MKAFWPVTTVGLDLGSTQTKAVVVRLALGGARPAKVLRAEPLAWQEVEDSPPPEGLPVAPGPSLSQKFIRAVKSGAIISAGLSGDRAFYRFLKLPALKGEKLRRAGLFGLEEHLPRSVDGLRADIAGMGGRQDRRLVMAMDGVEILSALEGLERAGLRLENVSLDTVGLIALAGPAKLKNGIMVDIGAEKATIICLAEGRPVALGHSAQAGKAMDRLLARTRGVDEDQARALKEEIAHPAEAEEVLRPVLDDLARDIDQLAKAAYTKSENPPEKLLLCGGASRLPGLAEFLGRKLGLEAGPLRPFRRKLPPEAMAAAGLALSAADFNLARGLIPNRPASRLLKAIFAVTLVALVLAGANLWRLNDDRRKALDSIRQTQRQLVQEGLPHLQRVVSPLRQTEMELAKAKEELAALSSGQSAMTMLETIRALDARVDVKKVRLSDMVVDGGRVTISGLAETFEALEKFKAELGEKGGFKEVILASSKKDGTGVRFQLRMNR